MADVAAQVAAGARHITFGDPDFWNGPRHARALVCALHERFPGVSFDVTIKIEHLVRHADRVPELARAGCLFVVSAAESLSDVVLAHLAKGHTRGDIEEALRIVRAAGLSLRPSFVAFTPWTTLDDYLELLDWIERADLVDCVDSVQLTIRLLVPPGSLLERYPPMARHLGRLIGPEFAYPWRHPDPRMDELAARVLAIVREGVREGRAAGPVLDAVRVAALDAAGGPRFRPVTARRLPRPPAPRLTEPWFC
jgi:hypothetical protein